MEKQEEESKIRTQSESKTQESGAQGEETKKTPLDSRSEQQSKVHFHF